MNRVAILMLADTETHADLGRVVNAMMTAKEFHEAGDDVQLIFDGAGTGWLGVLSDPDHSGCRWFTSRSGRGAGMATEATLQLGQIVRAAGFDIGREA